MLSRMPEEFQDALDQLVKQSVHSRKAYERY